MPISILDLDDNVTKVVLSGRIDIAGARQLEMPLAVIAGSRRAVVIDLSSVDFMASLGLRGIVVSAKAIFRKSGKIVLLFLGASMLVTCAYSPFPMPVSFDARE